MPPSDDPAKLQWYLISSGSVILNSVYFGFLHTESRVRDVNRLNIIIEQYHKSHFLLKK